MPSIRSLAVLLLLVSSTAHAQANVEEANQRVAHGEQLFAAGDYDGALAEFEQAYEVIGQHPTRFVILYNIGQSHERRFRYDLAMRYYRRYLEEGGPGAPDRAAVEASIRSLEGLLATLNITSNVPAEVWIEDRQVGEAPGEVLVPGGRHVVELRAAGYGSARQEVQVAPRTSQALTFELTSYGAGLEPTFFYLSVVATGLTALAGGGFGIAALLMRADVDNRLRDPVDMWTVGDGPRGDIQTMTITADVLFGAALLFATTSVILGLLTDFGGGGGSSEEAAPQARLVPGLGGLVLEGWF